MAPVRVLYTINRSVLREVLATGAFFTRAP